MSGGAAFPSAGGSASGMDLRDYFATHSTQPGCSEICALKGLRYIGNSVWSDEITRIDSFNLWWESLPLEERLDLSARVRYLQADAMLKARKS